MYVPASRGQLPASLVTRGRVMPRAAAGAELVRFARPYPNANKTVSREGCHVVTRTRRFGNHFSEPGAGRYRFVHDRDLLAPTAWERSKLSKRANGGCTSVTSSVSTSAADMPSLSHAHISASCSGEPCSIASTDPSIRLRTQPVTPSAVALRTQASL